MDILHTVRVKLSFGPRFPLNLQTKTQTYADLFMLKVIQTHDLYAGDSHRPLNHLQLGELTSIHFSFLNYVIIW